MVIVLIVVFGSILALTAGMVAYEMRSAILMPDSWRDDIGEYVKCSDCIWTSVEAYSFFGEPGPGCMECPFRVRPEDGGVER